MQIESYKEYESHQLIIVKQLIWAIWKASEPGATSKASLKGTEFPHIFITRRIAGQQNMGTKTLARIAKLTGSAALVSVVSTLLPLHCFSLSVCNLTDDMLSLVRIGRFFSKSLTLSYRAK